MAKIYGLNGTLRGRQGNNVFAVQNGTQIVRAYQPVVSNPRTSAQQLVRVRFALAGKISGFTPALALSGMPGGSARSRRAAFVSGLSRAAVASAEADGYKATLQFGAFRFSRGTVARWSSPITPTAVIASNGIVTVTVPGLTALSASPANYRELAICGLFDVSGSPLDDIRCAEHSRAGNNTFLFHQNLPVNAVVAVWVVPYILRSRVSDSRAGNVGITDDNSSVVVSTFSDTRVADADWGESILAGTVVLTPSRDGDTDPEAGETKRKR